MPPDLAGLKQLLPVFRIAFPDVEVVTEDMVAEGDRVVDRVTARGTHQGEFMGIPPSGKRFEIQEIHIARIAGGKIVERCKALESVRHARPAAADRRHA